MQFSRNNYRIFYSENRYLLFLTENYAALDILEHYIRGKKHVKPDLPVDVSTESTISSKPFTLFGSSFPKDKEYTQVNELQKIIFTEVNEQIIAGLQKH